MAVGIGVITMQAAGNPDGVFTARFTGVEPFAGQQDFGPALRWKWAVLGGQHAGCEISLISAVRATAKNKTGMVIGGLAGKPLQVGEPFDPAQHVGKVYTVVVQAGKVVGVSVPPQQ